MDSLSELTLADIMNRQVRHVLPECTLMDAAGQMNEAHISSLLVMSGDRPLGIITERDLLRLLNTHPDKLTTVSDVMSVPVMTASPDMGFTSAYALVLNHHIRHLVVVDASGDVVGLASETDFRNHLGTDLLHRLDDLKSVMDNNLPQLASDAMLDQAVAVMLRDRTSYALVIEQGHAIGILTERDMAGLMAVGIRADEVPLHQVMHAPVLTVSHRTPVYEMANLMQARQLRHLVVVDDDAQVVGMVTLHRLLERIAATVMNEQTLRHRESLECSKQQTESLLRTIVQTIPDLIWLKNVDGVYLSCNPMFERFFGASASDIIGKTDYDFVGSEQADFFREHDRIAMSAGIPSVNEEWITFADDGLMRCVETTKSPMFDAAANLIGVLGISHDITARKVADGKIQRLTQLYNALSQCNQAIVRCPNQDELFERICRVAVQFGGFKMAWVGMVNELSHLVSPVAFEGEGVDFLHEMQISADENSPFGHGPTGTAIRENRPFWCQDYHNDSVTAPWHERGIYFGWGSSASLPLYRNGIAVGAFNLYSSDTNAFDEAARNLLQEMAADISFALDNFEREAVRARLEKQSESERSMLELLARGRPLPTLLNHLASSYETMFPGMLCSVLLLSRDGGHLVHGAAPGLPDAYCAAIDGAATGPAAGSCGTAAYTGKTVVVSDIAHDPRWQDYKELAKLHGLAACWSVPVMSTQNQVLGAFALYYRAPRSPSPAELAALERGAHLASLAIERAQTEIWLNKLSQAVEQSPNTIVITDLDAKIEYANGAFTRETGYSLTEVMGKNQNILHSGKNPQAIYSQMWARLTAGEMWRGELTNRRKNGSEYIESVLISPVRQADGQVSNYLSIKENVSAKKQAEARITQLAHFDILTGLPNQTLLKNRVGQAMQMTQRSGAQLAVLFLDIDHFKNINDTLGHRIGDELLIQLAERLKSLVREEDTLSRMGGDEFIFVLPNTDEDGAACVAGKILETVAQTCHIGQYELVVTPSIGIAMYPRDGQDFDRLYQNADVAMYRAKQGGRNNFRFFTAQMQQWSARRLQLENALRHALAGEQFEVYYQPQLSIQDGHVLGAEALLRWRHPELGEVSPAEFIPIAEETGLILSIGEWVLRTVAQQSKRWIDNGYAAITIAVNLSAVQFRQVRLPEIVMRIIDEAGLLPQHIELELTESVAMDAPLAAIAVMDDLHARGIRMSIDDFGTGYSSLSYLRKFKVNKLKIDQSFVRDICEDPESRAIVTAIITLAGSMGFQTIAEGVETAGQLEFLRQQGCDQVQGYYFSKPLPVLQFEAFICSRI
jgi:diguanylate cyclase (GGDEF)-like protein/PAS domain S-box-containing protein